MDIKSAVKDFEIFKDAMIEENLQVQIEITKKLASLAKLLGEQVTRNELLPFIQEHIDFHDQILLNLSEQLKQFVPLVGGYKNSKCVLDLLVKLCNTDETTVRDKTIETLKGIGEKLNDELAEKLFLPLVQKLANEEWFTSKYSAAALFSTCYPKLGDNKKSEIRKGFCSLMQDDSAMVRKAAANCSIDIIGCIELPFLKTEFIPVFDNIVHDTMDSVRVMAVDMAVAIAKRLTLNEVEEFLMKVFEDWSDDSSWRLRQHLAFNIAEIQRAIPYPKTRGRILSIFQKLVKDSEPDVRILAAENLRCYCEALKNTYLNEPQVKNNFEPVFEGSIMPQINFILKDNAEEVRIALASNLLSLSQLLTEACFKKNILPVLVCILEQESSVRLQALILQTLNYLPKNIDLRHSLNSVSNVIKYVMATSRTQWRARRGIVMALVHVSQFADKEYFSKELKTIYAALLGDKICAVRRTAITILPLLAKHYGITWTIDNIIPYFKMFKKDCRYLYRFIPLLGLTELINSSLIEKCEYLKNMQTLIEGSDENLKVKATFKLAKLRELLIKLHIKLKEQRSIGNMFQLHEEIDHFEKEDIRLYADDVLDDLKENYDVDVFKITKDSIINNEVYLEGCLKLLISEFLPMIQNLCNDTTKNVQMRSMYALYVIKNFADELGRECSKSWVEDCLKRMSRVELDKIKREVNEELQRKLITVLDEEKVKKEITECIKDHENTERNVENVVPKKVCVNLPERCKFNVTAQKRIDNVTPKRRYVTADTDEIQYSLDYNNDIMWRYQSLIS